MDQIIELRSEITKLLNKVDQIIEERQKAPSRFITRQEILAEHKRTWYENMRKVVPPIKQGGKTSTAKYERKVYNTYVESLQS